MNRESNKTVQSSQVDTSLETAVYLIYNLNGVWRSCDQINRIDAHYESCVSRKTRIQQQVTHLHIFYFTSNKL